MLISWKMPLTARNTFKIEPSLSSKINEWKSKPITTRLISDKVINDIRGKGSCTWREEITKINFKKLINISNIRNSSEDIFPYNSRDMQERFTNSSQKQTNMMNCFPRTKSRNINNNSNVSCNYWNKTALRTTDWGRNNHASSPNTNSNSNINRITKTTEKDVTKTQFQTISYLSKKSRRLILAPTTKNNQFSIVNAIDMSTNGQTQPKRNNFILTTESTFQIIGHKMPTQQQFPLSSFHFLEHKSHSNSTNFTSLRDQMSDNNNENFYLNSARRRVNHSYQKSRTKNNMQLLREADSQGKRLRLSHKARNNWMKKSNTIIELNKCSDGSPKSIELSEDSMEGNQNTQNDFFSIKDICRAIPGETKHKRSKSACFQNKNKLLNLMFNNINPRWGAKKHKTEKLRNRDMFNYYFDSFKLSTISSNSSLDYITSLKPTKNSNEKKSCIANKVSLVQRQKFKNKVIITESDNESNENDKNISSDIKILSESTQHKFEKTSKARYKTSLTGNNEKYNNEFNVRYTQTLNRQLSKISENSVKQSKDTESCKSHSIEMPSIPNTNEGNTATRNNLNWKNNLVTLNKRNSKIFKRSLSWSTDNRKWWCNKLNKKTKVIKEMTKNNQTNSYDCSDKSLGNKNNLLKHFHSNWSLQSPVKRQGSLIFNYGQGKHGNSISRKENEFKKINTMYNQSRNNLEWRKKRDDDNEFYYRDLHFWEVFERRINSDSRMNQHVDDNEAYVNICWQYIANSIGKAINTEVNQWNKWEWVSTDDATETGQIQENMDNNTSLSAFQSGINSWGTIQSNNIYTNNQQISAILTLKYFDVSKDLFDNVYKLQYLRSSTTTKKNCIFRNFTSKRLTIFKSNKHWIKRFESLKKRTVNKEACFNHIDSKQYLAFMERDLIIISNNTYQDYLKATIPLVPHRFPSKLQSRNRSRFASVKKTRFQSSNINLPNFSISYIMNTSTTQSYRISKNLYNREISYTQTSENLSQDKLRTINTGFNHIRFPKPENKSSTKNWVSSWYDSPYIRDYTRPKIKHKKKGISNSIPNKDSFMYKTSLIKNKIIEGWTTAKDSIIYHIKDGNFQTFVEIFLKFQIDKESKDEEENTLLIISVLANCIEITSFLLGKGAYVNACNKYKNTALHYAWSYRNYDLADIWIKHGANDNLKNCRGWTPWQCLNVDISWISWHEGRV